MTRQKAVAIILGVCLACVYVGWLMPSHTGKQIRLRLIVATCPTVENGHPVNCQGFVTDGSPQLDDNHCVGNPSQRVTCVVARRPQCVGHMMTQAELIACWAPALNQYGAKYLDVYRPWSPSYMARVMYCESKGYTNAYNGNHRGLLQETNGSYDAAQNIIRGHDHFFVEGGTDQWQCRG